MTVKVTAQPECAWTAVGDAPWISSLEPAAGQGDGTIEVIVAPNATSSTRQTDLTINGAIIQIAQEGAPCRFGLDPPASAVPASGGVVTMTVTTLAGCTWTAESTAGWLTPTSGATGTGSGTISFSASSNTGAARTTSVTVADQSATVSQASPGNCPAVVAPTSASVAAAGDTLTVMISTDGGCFWTASSQAPWVTVSPAAGTGPGSVTLTAAANSGVTRTALLSIAGQAVTLTQSAAGCSYELRPGTHAAPAAGGPSSVAVTAKSGCAWTAVADAPWIVLTGETTGAGSGTVAFSVAANGGAARSGSIRVADRTFVVSQEGVPQSCAFALSGTSLTLSAAGGPAAPVTVTTGTNCTWTASTSSPWITITSAASTTGSGALAFTVLPNTGAERRGTIAVAGQAYRVTQTAAPPQACTYAISPTAQSVGAAGGAGAPIAVTTGAGCAWTASSNAGWLTIAGASAGIGNGTVAFAAAANSGVVRSGTLTVAGRTFTVSQATTCSYAIAPSTVAISSDGGTASTTVTAPAGCTWMAESNDTWITITSGASGSGPGAVVFSIGMNRPAHPRTGTISIGPLTLTVNQASKKDD